MRYDPSRLLEFVRDGAEIYQEIDDRAYVDYVKSGGGEALRDLAEILKAQVDATDETIACYSAHLIIRSEIPGGAGVILEALRIPFRSRTVRAEVLETIFDDVVGHPNYLSDPEFVAEAARIEPGYPWVREQIARFLDAASKRSG